MKKTFIYILIVITCIGCSKPESKVEKGVLDFLLQNGATKDGYEPIETIAVDTINTQDLASDANQYFERRIRDAQGHIDRIWKERATYGEDYDERSLNYLQVQMSSDHEDLAILKNLNNEIEFYVFKHKCRLKNGYGAFEAVELNVLTDSDYQVLFVYNYAVDGEATSRFYKKYKLKDYNALNHN